MSKLSVDHLLSIKNLKKTDIELILKSDTSKKLLINPSKVPTLGILQSYLFFENSTRTRLSFELKGIECCKAIQYSSVNKEMTLVDTVNNILSMKVDMVVMST